MELNAPAGRPTVAGGAGADPARLPAELLARLAAPGAGLLLDLDGTLLDSEPVHRAAFVEYFGSRGWEVPEEVVHLFSGRRAGEVFSSLDGPWRGEDPDELTEGVIAVLRRSTARPVPVPGAVDLLSACAATGLPTAVVTSARRGWAHAALTAFGTEVPPLITAEDCTHGKPDPEPYRRGARLLDLDPAGLVAAEDAVAGIASARGAGVGYVIALTTSQPATALSAADLAVADLRALARAVLTRRQGGTEDQHRGPAPRTSSGN